MPVTATVTMMAEEPAGEVCGVDDMSVLGKNVTHAVIAAALFVAACSGPDTTPDIAARAEQTATTQQPAGQTPATDVFTRVEVIVTDNAVDAPATLAAGPALFVLTSRATVTRVVTLTAPNGAVSDAKTLRPGETMGLSILLEPGTYRVSVTNAERSGQEATADVVVR